MTLALYQPQLPATLSSPQGMLPRAGSYSDEDAGEYLSLDHRKKKFEDAQQLSETGRRLSEQDRDYYDHKQWTSQEIAKLRLRGQVPIVINRIQRKVDTICGVQERAATDPIGLPRTPNDEQAGEVATDALRYVCDEQNFKYITSGMFKNLCIEGTAGCEVTIEDLPGGDVEIVLKRCRWETLFWDGHSREEDFSDASYKGFAQWMFIDDITSLFGKEAGKMAEAGLDGLGSGGMTTATGPHADRPTIGQWMDRKNRRVLVVDMWCKYQGQWTHSIFCSAGDLIDPTVSPFTDEHGEPICPIEMASVYVDRENQRYGIVRGMIGPQDEINYRRSKFLHFISTRQTYANSAAVDNVDTLKAELGKPHGHIELNGKARFGEDFGIIETTDMAQGQAELLQEAKAEIDLLGPNNALQGRGPQEQSGKAWLAQQQAGLAELAMLYSTLNGLQHRIYRQIWYRIRQYWTAPKYVRVSDDANAFKFTYVNEPVVDEMGNPVMTIDPQTGQPVPAMKNRPAEMDVDITVDSSPDTTTAMAEQFEALVRLAELGAPIPPDIIIEASSLRNKRQILDRLQQAQQAPPQPTPKEQIELQQEGERIQNETLDTVSQVQLRSAQAAKARADAAAAVHNALNPLPQNGPSGRPGASYPGKPGGQRSNGRRPNRMSGSR